jgi:thiol-disulfide isomerase/thioredoxin
MDSIKRDKKDTSEIKPYTKKPTGWKKNLPKIILILVLLAAFVVLYPKLFGTRVDKSNSSSSGSSEVSNTTNETDTSSQAELSKALADKKVAVLCFHSTTCQPCIEMDEIIEEIKPKFEDKVDFISVVVDDPKEKPLIEKYEIQLIPTTFIFNRKGEAQKQVGVIPKEQLTETLEKLVNE